MRRSPEASQHDIGSERPLLRTSSRRFRWELSYFHAGGIDRPLVIWKNSVGSVVTHQNWRGQFARGTWGEGTGRVGQSSDCAAWPSSTECVPVAWPGWNTGAWHDEAAKPQTVGTDTDWLGSLSVGMRDASGQMYMRNRYYNPETGQFTQPDPIGLAGGLNSYGFAAGDPVSYSDPYGLCQRPKGSGVGICVETLSRLNGSSARDGTVTMDGGGHDGFPSYEVWAYSSSGQATNVYHHKEGWVGELAGVADVKVDQEKNQ
jgi:RHS repeat-associated protein